MNSKQKKRFAQILAIVLAVALLLPLFSCVTTREETQFGIVFTGGMDGRVETDKDVVGAALLGGFVDRVRASYGQNMLLLDAGDFFYGKSVVNFTEGQLALDIANALEYDAMNIGSGDFSYGADRLLELEAASRSPMLSANIAQDGKDAFAPYVIKKIGKVKIGIAGLIGSETAESVSEDLRQGITFEDEIETARGLISKLKKQSNIVIMLTYMGADRARELAAAVSGVDIIIEGSGAGELAESGERVGNTLIVRPGQYGSKIGFLNLTLSGKHLAGCEVQLLDNAILGDTPPKADIAAMITDAKAQVTSTMTEVIGTAAGGLDGERGQIRTQETNLGDFVADFMRAVTGADLAMITSGNIRQSIETGDITREDIYNVLPYEDKLVTVQITGSMLLQILEHSVADLEENSAFLQISGLRIQVDRAAEPGHRIADYTVNSQAVEADRLYTVAVNSYLKEGGDGYAMFAEIPAEKEFGWMCELFETYLKANGNIYCETDGRIAFFN